jgi:hypothetical protein
MGVFLKIKFEATKKTDVELSLQWQSNEEYGPIDRIDV